MTSGGLCCKWFVRSLKGNENSFTSTCVFSSLFLEGPLLGLREAIPGSQPLHRIVFFFLGVCVVPFCGF